MVSTAIVHLLNNSGRKHECRALSRFTSERHQDFACESWIHFPSVVSNGHFGCRSHWCERSNTRHNPHRTSLQMPRVPYLTCLIMDRTISSILNFRLLESAIRIPPHIILADPQFCFARRGNDQLWDIMCMEQYKLGKSLPVLIKSQLEWVFGGRIKTG